MRLNAATAWLPDVHAGTSVPHAVAAGGIPSAVSAAGLAWPGALNRESSRSGIASSSRVRQRRALTAVPSDRSSAPSCLVASAGHVFVGAHWAGGRAHADPPKTRQVRLVGPRGDHDRPLAKRGRRQAPDAGRWLAVNVESIDLAVVSTARRARTTWDLVSDELEKPPETRHDAAAYAASVSELLDIVRDLDEALGTVVLVGHNPGIEDLAETLTGHSVPMPTSALAVVELTTIWDGVGRVRGLLRAAGRPPTSTG